jgi:hypothetical protein
VRHYIARECSDIQMAGDVRLGGRDGTGWLRLSRSDQADSWARLAESTPTYFVTAMWFRFLSHIPDDEKVLLSKLEDVGINPSDAYPCHATWRAMYWDPLIAALEQLHNSSNSLPAGHMWHWRVETGVDLAAVVPSFL